MAKRKKDSIPRKRHKEIKIKLPRITEDTVKFSLFAIFLLIFFYMWAFSIGIYPFSNGKYATAQYTCQNIDTNCGSWPNCVNCNNQDGWYDNGITQWVTDPTNECREIQQKQQEYRNYGCSSNSCVYSVTSTRWVDTANWRNKQDGTACTDDGNPATSDFCSGGSCIHVSTCQGTDTSCGTSTCTNCNQQDNWYDTGNTQWVNTGQCRQKEQKEQEFRDYRCGGTSCVYSVTTTRWVDTGNNRNAPDGTSCAQNKVCTGGACTLNCPASKFVYKRICKSYTQSDWNSFFRHPPNSDSIVGNTYYSCPPNDADEACVNDNTCVYSGLGYPAGTLLDVDADSHDELCVVGSNGQWAETEQPPGGGGDAPGGGGTPLPPGPAEPCTPGQACSYQTCPTEGFCPFPPDAGTPRPPGIPGNPCASDTNCGPYEYCDTAGTKSGTPFTCYDFRLEMTGCKYYDFCKNSQDPNIPATSCSSNWNVYCYTAASEQVDQVRAICQGASFVKHTWFTCPIG